MKFWDTSALVPLVVDEPATVAVRDLVARDPNVVVWLLTGVELLSAIARLGRAASGLEDLATALQLEALSQARRWTMVTDVDGVRRRAERLVGVHPIAPADALQLGAALVTCRDRPESLEIVTLDKVLARAAQLEGFPVVPLGPPFSATVRRRRTSSAR
jgi:predicted nucleic acid-binding protein